MGQKNAEYKLVRARFDFDKHYDIVGSWWKKHKSLIPQREYLPETGLIVFVDDKPVCSGFIYKTDSVICILAWVVCNPDANKKERDSGLNYLIKSFVQWSEKAGFKIIHTSVGGEKYLQRLEDEGFTRTDKGKTHMFYGMDDEWNSR